MHIQESHWSSTSAVATGGGGGGNRHSHAAPPGGGRTAPLRVDAQRNLEHVLRAAREVFGELGYGAPMEDVARRARVGVGTVYRRFPSKDVLVRRIAEEETARLTDQARTALGQEDEPWSALSRFLRTSVASGAGRLLPPQVLRVPVADEGGHDNGSADGDGGAGSAGGVQPGVLAVGVQQGGVRVPPQRTELRLVEEDRAPADEQAADAGADDVLDDPGTAALLEVVGRLVDRTRAAGELREDVTVSDVLLVIATAAPALPDAAQQTAASARLLDILLEGLRSRPA